MSGALAERVFVKKLRNVGFESIEVVTSRPFGLADAARYPLFTPDLIDLMTELIPEDRHDRVATAITVRATRPAE